MLLLLCIGVVGKGGVDGEVSVGTWGGRLLSRGGFCPAVGTVGWGVLLLLLLLVCP